MVTPAQYRTCLGVLGLTHKTAGEVLGCSWRQSYRWAKGDSPLPRPVALVLLTCIAQNMFPEQLAAEADAALKVMRRASAA